MECLLDPIQLGVLGKLIVAFVFGALIGIEREMLEKPAGLRTHMLVTGAACLLVTLNDLLATSIGSHHGVRVTSDPIRMVQSIVTGISFLGAGTIIHGRSTKIGGLTTAASLLMASVVGIYVGLSQFVAAFGISLLTLGILRYLPHLDERLHKKNNGDDPKPL